MNIIIILAICMGTSSLSMFCLIMLCIKYNYYTDIILFLTENNRNVIAPPPRRNMSTINVKPKKEIELIPIKKYVVIQSPDQQFSIGVEIEPLSI